MGAKSPAAWSPADWRAQFPTVTLMRKARWLVWAKCPRCGARAELNLAEVELELGPSFSLWGRRPACRTMLCRARVRLVAMPPRAPAPFSLSDEPRATPAVQGGRQG